MIGADYRIPEPSEEWKANAIQALQEIGVHHPEHRKRLVDVGSPVRRTPPAETK